MVITEQELIAKRLAANSTNTTEYIIKQLIQEHDTREMERGVSYYHNRNDIKKRQQYFFDEHGNKAVDPDAINYRIPHNWHKLLVDQKVSYLLGRPIVLSADPNEYANLLNAWLDEDWDDIVQELGKNCSNKGVEYLHPFIDEQGNFDYVIIPAEQVIPVYDTDYEKNLVYVIRYYPFWVNNRETIRAEWWDRETVTYFIQAENGAFELETPGEGRRNPDSHFYYNGRGYGWGRVPFVEFRNNEEKLPDLQYYREIIDIYDLVVSDLANDIASMQKLIYVLKGYEGTSMKEFINNIRHFRSIKVSAEQGAGVDVLQTDIPVNAIDSFLNRAEENIFLFGQGVNVKTNRFGNSPSGIALKFLFHLLDLKANIMARKFAKAIKQFCWFLTEYLAISGEYAVPKDAIDTVKVTFSKSLLINDLELVQMAAQSKGLISNETIVANHPWVDDAQAELEKMQQERPVDLDALDDEEGEEE